MKNKHIEHLEEMKEKHIELFWEDSKYIKHIQDQIDILLDNENKYAINKKSKTKRSL